jgi:predicted nucleic acid-binding protein
VILVDTSVWIDHLRSGDEILVRMLERGTVLSHPYVIGEIALGQLRHREEVLALLDRLPQATVATADEVRTLIERDALFGQRIGYVDAQLLAATRLTAGARLWSRDRRLAAVTRRFGLAFVPTGMAT